LPKADFEIAAQVEKDPIACQTLRFRTIFRELKKLSEIGTYWDLVREQIDEQTSSTRFPKIEERCAAQVINREFGS